MRKISTRGHPIKLENNATCLTKHIKCGLLFMSDTSNLSLLDQHNIIVIE